MRLFSNAEENDMNHARPFTGYHAAAIIVGFFAVVIAVNFTMARYAVSTFGGTVVDNSYVASQKFNGWLAESRRERELGWTVAGPARDGDHLRISMQDKRGEPLAGASIRMRAVHPLGRAPDRELHFKEIVPGAYRSIEVMPAGRWMLRAVIARENRTMKLAFEVD
jgi:nitrogen fixation protein FixH